MLVLASGYLFTALIVIPHALAFPGAFAPAGLFGAGFQTTAALYRFWHYGFPAAVLVYALLKSRSRTNTLTRGSARYAIGWSVAIVIFLVSGLTWVATTDDRFIPPISSGSVFHTPAGFLVNMLNVWLAAFVLVLLWRRQSSVLDQWLMVVMRAWISELVMVGAFSNARFSLGFYAGRVYSLITSIIVLVVLLSQTTRLYQRLAQANVMLQRERNNKLLNIDAITSSIVHEVRQPLAAIAANGSAGMRWLAKTPPDFHELRALMTRIVEDSHHAGELLESIRTLFKSTNLERQSVDLNEIVLKALNVLGRELKDHGVITRIGLAAELPLVGGHSGQLQEVVLNLFHNAIDAMDSITDRVRLLRVTTESHGRDAISVSVEDSGPGIDPKKMDGIFDAVFTTKSRGMGLGLAISRMIIDRHGGQLTASSDIKTGALFRFILPIGEKAQPPKS